MFFTSYEFIGFVAALFLLYYTVPKKYQQALLLGAGYVFYFMGGGSQLIYILATTVTTYVTARKIEENETKQRERLKERKDALSAEEKKEYKERQKKKRFFWMAVCILLNIGILAAVKYANFAISNLNAVLGALGNRRQISFVTLMIPMGISFYTFQAIGYLIDVYRGACAAEKNPFRFALFVSFFPQLIQGPISRYGDLSETLCKEHSFDGKTVAYGLQRILWGYFKKMVIADRMLVGVSAIVSDASAFHGAYIFAGMIFYTIELYADFTGGIDITIGIAETMGIRMKENFVRPYASKSLKEYWRRWHISMCSWFRDYIFYPVSICKPMQRFSKFSKRRFGEKAGKRLPVYISSFLVWFATGIWHGASWNFIVWGLLNWAVLMISEELEPLYAKFHRRFPVKEKFLYQAFQIARTFLLICVLNLFDCYDSLAYTVWMICSVFNAHNWRILINGSLLSLGLRASDYWILLFGVILLAAVSLWQRDGSVRDKIAEKSFPVRFCVWYGLFLTVLLFGVYGIGYDASQFIYNRF